MDGSDRRAAAAGLTSSIPLTMMASVTFRAGVAQLVEYELPKLGVAGSNPVARSSMQRIIR